MQKTKQINIKLIGLDLIPAYAFTPLWYWCFELEIALLACNALVKLQTTWLKAARALMDSAASLPKSNALVCSI